MGKKEIILDSAEIAAKTLLSAIPVGGTLITETWNVIKSHSLAKRNSEWQKTVEEKLAVLDVSLEEIGNNELFTTTIVQATEQALKTSSEKKRECLANAVINSLNMDVEESIILIYLDMIARYSELHIIILSYFFNPISYGVDKSKYYMGSPKQPLFDTFPKLRSKESIVDRIVKDLYNDGVMASDDLNVMMTSDGMVASRTTELGKQLIDFISSK